MIEHIVFVACSKRKLDQPAAAKDLYTGALFQAARHYAEDHGDRWYILSAKYGLVHPNIRIRPYQQALAEMPAANRRHWSRDVLRCFFELSDSEQALNPIPGPDKAMLTFLAGEVYRRDLVHDLRNAGYHVGEPLAGLGYGQQLAWLARQPGRRPDQVWATCPDAARRAHLWHHAGDHYASACGFTGPRLWTATDNATGQPRCRDCQRALKVQPWK